MLEATKDEDSDVRQAAVRALTKLKAVDLTNLELLQESTKDRERRVRQAAVEALVSLKTVHPASLKLLLEATKDEDSGVRQAAARALTKLKAVDPTSLELLQESTKNQDSDVRQAAVKALGKLQTIDSPSLALLHNATKDRDSNVRQAAASALAEITLEQHIEVYWATKNKQLIPYIVYRLYQAPLVIDQRQAMLYRTAGQRKTWQKPAADLQHFVALIKYEASQTKQGLEYQADQGPEYYEQCLARIQAFGLDNHPDVALVLRNVGIAYHNLGNDAQALEYYQQALQMRQELHKRENHADVAVALSDVGDAYKGLGHYAQAFEYYQQALQMRQELHEYAEALEHSKQALQMRQELHKRENHADVAAAMRTVAIAYQNLNKYTQALEYYQQALQMYQEVHEKKDHADVARNLRNVGVAYRNLGKHTESLEYSQQALTMQQALHEEENHADVALGLNSVGVAYQNLGKHTESLEYYQQALTMQQALHEGEKHADVAANLRSVGWAYQNLSNHTEALEYFKPALEMYQALHKGENHADVAAAMRTVGLAYEGLGKYTQALEYYQQALAMYQALHEGENHADVAQVLNDIGASLKEWFRKGLEQVRIAGYGPASPGGRLLGLLTDSLQVFRSVLRQAPGLLDLLQQYAKYKEEDCYGGYHVRQAAVEALGVVISVVPGESEAILATLREAAKDGSYSVRKAASKFLDPSMDLVGASASNRPAPQDNPQRFTGLLKSKASQTEQIFHTYKLGKTAWERYFGDVGEEPVLPTDIEAIMHSSCPFWPGNKVKETHLLVLIPSHVAGKPLTLDYLGELLASPQGEGRGTKYGYFWDKAREAIGSQSPDSSYWVLMTRGVLPGSRYKSYRDQFALVANHANRTGLAYKVPGALEAAVVMLLHHVRSGEFLYGFNPCTYTRCRERVGIYQLVVGGFSSGGLGVYGHKHKYEYNVSAIAGLRKF